MRLCEIRNCNKPYAGRRGWCELHYTRWRRHGNPLILIQPKQRGPLDSICIIEGCNNSHRARGWCNMHYVRWTRRGDPMISLHNQQHNSLCSVKGCNSIHHAHGLCQNHYETKRRNENIDIKIRSNLSRRLRKALKGQHKVYKTIKGLDCSIATFKLYIENQFEEGMTWDNYGEWHLDHVLPLASYDLTDEEQFLEAANWLNYQPLWAKDNIAKGGRLA